MTFFGKIAQPGEEYHQRSPFQTDPATVAGMKARFARKHPLMFLLTSAAMSQPKTAAALALSVVDELGKMKVKP